MNDRYITDDGTGNYEERVKLVRATGIGNIPWDNIANYPYDVMIGQQRH